MAEISIEYEQGLASVGCSTGASFNELIILIIRGADTQFPSDAMSAYAPANFQSSSNRSVPAVSGILSKKAVENSLDASFTVLALDGVSPVIVYVVLWPATI